MPKGPCCLSQKQGHPKLKAAGSVPFSSCRSRGTGQKGLFCTQAGLHSLAFAWIVRPSTYILMKWNLLNRMWWQGHTWSIPCCWCQSASCPNVNAQASWLSSLCLALMAAFRCISPLPPSTKHSVIETKNWLGHVDWISIDFVIRNKSDFLEFFEGSLLKSSYSSSFYHISSQNGRFASRMWYDDFLLRKFVFPVYLEARYRNHFLSVSSSLKIANFCKSFIQMNLSCAYVKLLMFLSQYFFPDTEKPDFKVTGKIWKIAWYAIFNIK